MVRPLRAGDTGGELNDGEGKQPMRFLTKACLLSAVLLIAGCEDKKVAEIQAETETQLAALAEEGKLTNGAVTVEAEGDGYRVTIADVVVLTQPDMKLPLGEVSYLHEPLDDETVRYADIRISSPIQMQSAEGEPQGTITYELDSAEAVWSKPLESFISMNLVVPSAQIISSVEQSTVDIVNMTLKSDTVDPAAERTDQNGTLTIERMTVLGEEGDTVVIEGITAESRVMNVDVAAMAAASASFETATTTGENLAPSIVAMLKSFSATDANVTMSRLSHLDPAGAEDFAVTNMRVVGTLADADQQQGRLNFAIGYDSLTLPPAAYAEDPMVELLVPQVLAFNIDVAHVPFQQAATQLASIAPSVGQMRDQPEIAGLLLLSTLRAAFAEAGTTIRLDGTSIQLKDALMTVTGGVDVAPNAPLGVTGTMDISLFGLDALMQSAANLPPSPDADEFRATLEFLAAMSERGEDGGEVVDRYRVVADEMGAVTVNGQQVF
jgi:hypothetical protein